MFTPILAHGALGWWDELIFAGVAVLFFIMMGISWMRSRNTEYQEPVAPKNDSESDSPEYFHLD
jgi:hypothetical protein